MYVSQHAKGRRVSAFGSGSGVHTPWADTPSLADTPWIDAHHEKMGTEAGGTGMHFYFSLLLETLFTDLKSYQILVIKYRPIFKIYAKCMYDYVKRSIFCLFLFLRRKSLWVHPVKVNNGKRMHLV